MAHYQQRLSPKYDKGIRTRAYMPRDLVLRKVMGNMKNPTLGNWAPIGKDPIRVTLVAVTGAYHLEDLEEISLP